MTIPLTFETIGAGMAVVQVQMIASDLTACGVAEPKLGWPSLAEGLERDGLARIESTQEGELRVGLP